MNVRGVLEMSGEVRTLFIVEDSNCCHYNYEVLEIGGASVDQKENCGHLKGFLSLSTS